MASDRVMPAFNPKRRASYEHDAITPAPAIIIIMIPLATTELGTDSWVGDLMSPEMKKLGLPGLTVLIYTSFIMMVLR